MAVTVSLIVATARNFAIGKGNAMLWHIPADFKYFKRVTMGKPMVMGRKTFESLPGILPGRAHIVVSRSGFECDGVESVSDLNAALEMAKSMSDQDEVFIIGGAQIYALALQQKLVDRMYITQVDSSFEADAFFPDYAAAEWAEISREDHDGDPAFSFIVLEKK